MGNNAPFQVNYSPSMKSFYEEKLRGNPFGAIDIRADEDISLEPFSLDPYALTEVGTGFSIWLGSSGRNDVVGLLILRSSIGKLGVRLANSVGVIDPDYQGEITLWLQNMANAPVVFFKGDRVAQLVIVPSIFRELELVDHFSVNTERGASGYGSTGKD